MVGLEEVFQQTPLAVTTDPTEAVMLPPLTAVALVVDVMAVVVN